LDARDELILKTLRDLGGRAYVGQLVYELCSKRNPVMNKKTLRRRVLRLIREKEVVDSWDEKHYRHEVRLPSQSWP
jgi:hypothetical protein